MDYFKEIAKLVRQSAADTGMQLQDAAREFLAGNSVSESGAWQIAHANDALYVAQQIYLNAIGAPEAEEVQLLCGNMVNIMSGVLSELGIAKRNIWLYSDYDGVVLGHTYNEIFNTSTQKWEIQDADYNVYYVDSRTGERAGVIDMVSATDIEFFVPRNATASGWAETGAEGLRIGNFFSAQVITTDKVLHVNADSLSPTLLDGIAQTLDKVFAYTVDVHENDGTFKHFTDADASLANGRAVLAGGGGDDFVSYDGDADAPVLAQLSGGAGDDVLAVHLVAGQLYGNEGNDTLIGGIRADLLSGGAGDDYLSGGAGNDLYVFQLGDGDGDVIDSFGVGADQIVFLNASGLGGQGQTALSRHELDFRLRQTQTEQGVRVEYDVDGDGRFDGSFVVEGRQSPLATSDVAFSFRPDAAAGIITDSEGAIGGFAQSLWGTDGNNRLIYDGNDTVLLAGNRTGMNSGNDLLWSRSTANSALYGFDGDDVLVGGAGEDYLNGGGGRDTLVGNGGDDDYVFKYGDGDDDVIETFGDGADELIFSEVRGFGGAGQGHPTQRELDFRLRQVQTGDGLVVDYDIDGDGQYDGSILLKDRVGALGVDEVGLSFAADPLAGLNTVTEGAIGRFGASLWGSDGGDRLVYDGQDSVLIAGSRTGVDSGNDILWSRSDAGSALYGYDGDDILTSGAGDDYLNGGSGRDVLSGGAGDDDYVLKYGDGFGDVIKTYGLGADEIFFAGVTGFGGSGRTHLSEQDFALRLRQTDTDAGMLIEYDLDGDFAYDGSLVLEGYHAPLASAEVTFDFKADAKAGFQIAAEGAVGRFSASMFGTGAADRIVYEGNGSVLLAGSRNGSDSGDDLLWVRSAGNSALYGYDGKDVLIGGAGDDLLNGGRGDDLLTGGAGHDFFVLTSGGDHDLVSDFSSADDTLYIYGWNGTQHNLVQTLEDDGLLIAYDLDNDGIVDGSVKLIGQTSELGAADFLFG